MPKRSDLRRTRKLVNGEKFVSFSDGHSVVENEDFTTDDSSNPDFHFHAHKIRVYENDRVIFQNVTFYIGKVPVFWWPYSINR